jgi:mono/diheme cytochrome c family protein
VKTLLALLGVVFIALVAAGAGYIYSGAYDVAATAPDIPAVDWVVKTTRRYSLRARLGDIQAPANFDAPERVQAGFIKYHEDCEACHGFPGNSPGPIGAGLNPKPPKLWGESGGGPRPGSIYWIVMNGIKMTGMPSWSHEYSGDDAWSVVAFVRTLPKLSAEEYRSKVQALPAKKENATEASGAK